MKVSVTRTFCEQVRKAGGAIFSRNSGTGITMNCDYPLCWSRNWAPPLPRGGKLRHPTDPARERACVVEACRPHMGRPTERRTPTTRHLRRGRRSRTHPSTRTRPSTTIPPPTARGRWACGPRKTRRTTIRTRPTCHTIRAILRIRRRFRRQRPAHDPSLVPCSPLHARRPRKRRSPRRRRACRSPHQTRIGCRAVATASRRWRRRRRSRPPALGPPGPPSTTPPMPQTRPFRQRQQRLQRPIAVAVAAARRQQGE